jgi:multidrug efflux pump subunit AcrB
MGFTTEAVARQVRNSFEGAIGKRFSRNQEEIIVRIKLQESPNIRTSIRDLYLRASDGSEVPLTEVVSLKTQIGFSQVRREDGQRQVSVTADVDQQITTTNRVIAELSRNIIPAVEQEFGIQADFKGRAEEQQAALGDTQVALMIALAVIYVILAWVFASYTTPLVVMSVIPFGLVGAIIGHWVMGFNLNMLSLQALLGLFGVMINDSIILVSAINRARSSGAELTEAILVGTRERLRPVLLTTLTTIGGLTPLLFERSLQAQLVQPLAITLIFGLLFSLFLVLFFVPAVLGIGDDMKQKFLRRGPVGPEHTAESHA